MAELYRSRVACGVPDARSQNRGAMDEATALAKWSQLDDAMEQVFLQRRSAFSFQCLYQATYQLLQAGYRKFLYDKIEASMRDRLHRQLVTILSANGASLLRVLLDEWNAHARTTTRSCEIFLLLERQYCVGSTRSIKALGFFLFGEVILKSSTVSQRVREILIDAIDRERRCDGDVASACLKGLATMMVQVDPHEFESIMEAPYLQHAAYFYQEQSNELISTLTASQFVDSFFANLNAERARVARVLHSSTEPRIEAVMRTHFFAPHKAALLDKPDSGIEFLLKTWRTQDVQRMFTAFSFVDDVPLFMSAVEGYLLREGVRHVMGVENGGGNGGNTNPIAFVEGLCALKSKIDSLCNEVLVSIPSLLGGGGNSSPLIGSAGVPSGFSHGGNATMDNNSNGTSLSLSNHPAAAASGGGSSRVVGATGAEAAPASNGGGGAASNSARQREVIEKLTKVFTAIVNKNPMCAEHLTSFLDQKLKTVSDEWEIDQYSEQVLSIFKFLRDKDVFEHAFKLHLARRLLAAKGNVEDNERIFISKLKKEFGASATSKLEGMFADKRNSEELMTQFQARLRSRNETLPFELSVAVLTSGFWPASAALLGPGMPGEVDRVVALFRGFYLSRFSGRRLDFQLNQGSVDVRMTAGRRYELNVGTEVLPVLLLFEGDEVLTATEVSKRCPGLSVVDAGKILVSLVRGGAQHTGILKIVAAPATAATSAGTSSSCLLGSTPGPASGPSSVGSSCVNSPATSQMMTVARDSLAPSAFVLPPAVAAAGGGSSANLAAQPFTSNTAVVFNTEFRSKQLKIKVQLSTLVRDKDGSVGAGGGSSSASKQARTGVDEDRKYKIDAAIVRIMKSRRTLEHRELVAEVTNVLRNIFCPSSEDIKKRIEHLIERDFVERSQDSRSKYNYIA